VTEVPAADGTVASIAASVRAGEVSWAGYAETSLDHLRRTQEGLHTAITLVDELPPPPPEEVVRTGVLAGVPVLVKDVIDTAGLRTTRGSAIFRARVPDSSAECVRRLVAAGAIVVGKANLHEFAWGLTSRNPTWGQVVNPRAPDRTPGGSSGGNAAAIAAGSVPLGIATDTAGSIRIPAACCDVVGFTPSHGSVPTTGVFPVAPSLDTIGPVAATVRDCALAFEALTGRPLGAVEVNSLRIAATDSALAEMASRAGLSARIAPRPVPPEEAERILPYEAWLTHRVLVSHHAADYDPNVLAKLRAACQVKPAEYVAAQAAARDWRAATRAGARYDVLVCRALDVPVPAADVDELSVREEFGRAARWVNVLRWAAVVLGSVQVAGPDDAAVLAVAARLESAGRELHRG
jgi:aspartyl-tRNA(Asn)/glutamyl-tRNA(Gln) amidotransferase subunit A